MFTVGESFNLLKDIFSLFGIGARELLCLDYLYVLENVQVGVSILHFNLVRLALLRCFVYIEWKQWRRVLVPPKSKTLSKKNGIKLFGC